MPKQDEIWANIDLGALFIKDNSSSNNKPGARLSKSKSKKDCSASKFKVNIPKLKLNEASCASGCLTGRS